MLLIGVDYMKNEDGTVPSYESGFAHYEFKSSDDLLRVAKTYSKIERSNGKIERGIDYTERKAKNDFNALAVERQTNSIETIKKMKTKKTYSSKESFEAKNPYVLVQFETQDQRTIATIEKSFTNKKSADKYFENYGNRGQEVITRNKYNSIISNLM